MKLSYKASGLMALLSLGILLMVMAVSSSQLERQALNSGIANLSALSKEIANNIDTRLEEKAAVSIAFASSPAVSAALIESNRHYAAMLKHERDNKISALNQQWMSETGTDASFIQQHLNNPLAEYLRLQQTNMPGLYGEIFLTNRYGVMIASTGKLTTLAHAHKYWWIEAFNQGQGKIFFDDRGFDESVGGYVVGIVVPIKKDNQIIGILKSNINVMGLLHQVIKGYEEGNSGILQVVRSGGLIVMGEGLEPLSERLAPPVAKQLSRDNASVVHTAEGGIKKIVSISPIKITIENARYGFGGAPRSIDHQKGNLGEGWHVVIYQNREEMLRVAHHTRELLLLVGAIFTLVITLAALISGNMIARPLVALAERAKKIGRGDFEIRAEVQSDDEIGSLAESFNKMALDLKSTMISRDALREETEVRRELNDLLLESVADGIFGIDLNGNTTFINPAASQMLGYAPEEIIAQPICELISNDQADGAFCRRIGCAVIAADSHDIEQRPVNGESLRRKDGSTFVAEYISTPIRRGDELFGSVVTFRDITQREQARKEAALLQRQLQQSQKMDSLGKLTGGVAHDFNNMLSAILGYANLSMDLTGKPERVLQLQKYLQEVIKAGERSRDLVAQMLAFSRGEMGEVKRVELGNFVKDIIRMLRATIPSSIELRYSPPATDLYVETNAVQLNQAIMNLVINARDAIANESGTIEVNIVGPQALDEYCSSCHSAFSGEFVVLQVSDSGEGVSEQIAQNVFEPFFSTKEVGKGTGMGLSMVHGIMHGCGGHVRLQSQPDRGTAISLLFPEPPSIDELSDIAKDNTLEEGGTKLGHILVVDDEEALVSLLSEQLATVGYEVTAFTDPLTALERFEQSPAEFDLVITDQTMPGVSGDEFVRRLLQLRRDIPVILTTGYSAKMDATVAKEIGVSRFMLKPLDRDKLLQAVEQLLSPQRVS